MAMVNWNYGGYTAPAGVNSRNDVRELQRQLGVTADGLWGPKTQAAYDAANSGQRQSSIPAGYSNYLEDFQSLLANSIPTVSYTPMSRDELHADLTAALRPGYDLAIENRKKQTATNKANIDADAAARGMGASTWVTDVKDRAQDAEADDIATMESNFNATIAQQLMSALQNERANQLAADQFNASAQANALSAALGLAGDFYANDLATAKKANSGRSGSRKSDDTTALLDELENNYGGKDGEFVGNMINNIGKYAGKYTETAISQAKSLLENEYVKRNTNYGYK